MMTKSRNLLTALKGELLQWITSNNANKDDPDATTKIENINAASKLSYLIAQTLKSEDNQVLIENIHKIIMPSLESIKTKHYLQTLRDIAKSFHLSLSCELIMKPPSPSYQASISANFKSIDFSHDELEFSCYTDAEIKLLDEEIEIDQEEKARKIVLIEREEEDETTLTVEEVQEDHMTNKPSFH